MVLQWQTPALSSVCLSVSWPNTGTWAGWCSSGRFVSSHLSPAHPTMCVLQAMHLSPADPASVPSVAGCALGRQPCLGRTPPSLLCLLRSGVRRTSPRPLPPLVKPSAGARKCHVNGCDRNQYSMYAELELGSWSIRTSPACCQPPHAANP